MTITIQYMGQVKHAAGTSASEEIELPGPCSVLECLRRLTDRPDDRLKRFLLDESGQVSRSILLFLGQEQVRDAAGVMLKGGDVLTVLSPISGG